MLDIKLLRNDPDLLVATLRDRGVRVFEDLTDGDWAKASIDRLVELVCGAFGEEVTRVNPS